MKFTTFTIFCLLGRLASVGAIAIAMGCAPSRIAVTSVPDGADVVKLTGSGSRVALGKTPLTIDLEAQIDVGATALNLVVEHADFVNQSVLFPKTLGPSQQTLLVNLMPIPKTQGGPLEAAVECPKIPDNMLVQVTRAVAEIQGLIASKDYAGATTKLMIVSTQYPNISVLYDLLGNVNYLKHDYSEALKSYERSVQLEPQNLEASRMVRKVRGMLGLPEQQVGH